MSDPAITFGPEAYESAAMFFALLGRNPQNVTIIGGTGYMVRVHPRDGGESFVAEVVDTTEVEGADGTMYDAVIVQETDLEAKTRTLRIYEDIERVEVL